MKNEKYINVLDLNDEAIKQSKIIFQNKDCNIKVKLVSQIEFMKIDSNIYN
jgi:hypothetical protein